MKFYDPYYLIDPTKPHDPTAEQGRASDGRFTARLETNTLTDENFPIDSVWWRRYAVGTRIKLDTLRGEDFRRMVIPNEEIFSWRMICEMYEAARDALTAGKSEDEAIAAAHAYLAAKQAEVSKAELDAVMSNPASSALEQSAAIDKWMTANWETIPEVEL